MKIPALTTLSIIISTTIVQAWTTPQHSITKNNLSCSNSFTGRNILSYSSARTSSSLQSSSTQGDEYTVKLGLPPLGIVFEDVSSGSPSGVKVVALTTGGQGERCGKIEIGDLLKTSSAIQFRSGSSKFDIVDVDCTEFDFDTVISALTSNNARFGCTSVDLTFIRSANE